MRCITALAVVFLFVGSLYAQGNDASGFQVREEDGGTVVVRSASGILNQGSSLKRRWLSVNDLSAPVQLNKSGLYPRFDEKEEIHVLMPVGTAQPTQAVSAVEIRYMLFDVWGEHLSTLTTTRMVDTSTTFDLRDGAGWPAWENEVAQLVTVVAFVARVRLENGQIWTYDPERLTSEIRSLGLSAVPIQLVPDELRAMDPRSIYWSYYPMQRARTKPTARQ